jgi:hypothetical protein
MNVRELAREFQVMGHGGRGETGKAIRAVCVQMRYKVRQRAREQIRQAKSLGIVTSGSWLIEQKQPRFSSQESSDLNAAQYVEWQRRSLPIQGIENLESVADLALPIRLCQPPALGRCGLSRNRQRLTNGQRWENGWVLKRADDSRTHPSETRRSTELLIRIAASKPQGSVASRRDKSRNRIKQGGLAGAVRPHEDRTDIFRIR